MTEEIEIEIVFVVSKGILDFGSYGCESYHDERCDLLVSTALGNEKLAYHDGGNGQPSESAIELEGEEEAVYQSHLSLSAARPLDIRDQTYSPDMSIIAPRDRSSQDPFQRTQRLTHLLNRQQQRVGSRNIDRLSPLNSSQPR